MEGRFPRAEERKRDESEELGVEIRHADPVLPGLTRLSVCVCVLISLFGPSGVAVGQW